MHGLSGIFSTKKLIYAILVILSPTFSLADYDDKLTVSGRAFARFARLDFETAA